MTTPLQLPTRRVFLATGAASLGMGGAALAQPELPDDTRPFERLPDGRAIIDYEGIRFAPFEGSPQAPFHMHFWPENPNRPRVKPNSSVTSSFPTNVTDDHIRNIRWYIDNSYVLHLLFSWNYRIRTATPFNIFRYLNDSYFSNSYNYDLRVSIYKLNFSKYRREADHILDVMSRLRNDRNNFLQRQSYYQLMDDGFESYGHYGQFQFDGQVTDARSYILEKEKRLFETDKPLILLNYFEGAAGMLLRRVTYSNDIRVVSRFSFSPPLQDQKLYYKTPWPRDQWKQMDLLVHQLLDKLFLSSPPEGLD